MFEPTLSFGALTLNTFTFVFGAALLLGGGSVIRRAPASQRFAVTDMLIGGLVGALILARIEHVLLNWAHFSTYRGEIPQISAGGLEWHGALAGAALGMLLVSRWRNRAPAPVVDSLTMLLPLLALALWWGCWSSACNYGREVTTMAGFPDWLVWDGRDIYGIYAPRFHTQLLGMATSITLLLLTALMFLRGWLVQRRFWLVLTLLSASFFVIAFLQGDDAIRWNGLRVTQVLDLIVLVFAACFAVRRTELSGASRS